VIVGVGIVMAHDHRVAGAVAHPGSHRTQRADFPHCARQKFDSQHGDSLQLRIWEIQLWSQ